MADEYVAEGLFRMKFCRRSSTSFWFTTSRADVGSSKSTSFGFISIIRANTTRCNYYRRWPHAALLLTIVSGRSYMLNPLTDIVLCCRHIHKTIVNIRPKRNASKFILGGLTAKGFWNIICIERYISVWFWMDVTSLPKSHRLPEVGFSNKAINLSRVLYQNHYLKVRLLVHWATKGYIINGADRMIVVRILFAYILELNHTTPLSLRNLTRREYTYPWMRHDLFGGAYFNELAFIHNPNAIGNASSRLDIMGYNNHRCPKSLRYLFHKVQYRTCTSISKALVGSSANTMLGFKMRLKAITSNVVAYHRSIETDRTKIRSPSVKWTRLSISNAAYIIAFYPRARNKSLKWFSTVRFGFR